MALDIIATLQGDACVLIQTQGHVLLPDEAAKAVFIKSYGDTSEHFQQCAPPPQPRGLNKPVVRSMELLMEKLLVILGIIVFIRVFSSTCLYPPSSKKPPNEPPRASGTPCWPLRAHCEGWVCPIVRAGHEGWSTGGGHPEDMTAG